MPFLAPNQHCQNFKGNSKHYSQLASIIRCPHPLLIHWEKKHHILYTGSWMPDPQSTKLTLN